MNIPDVMRIPGPVKLLVIVGVIVCVVGVLCVSSALAVTGGPQWTVTAVSDPTDLVPEDESGDQSFEVTVMNTGGEASSAGEPVTVEDVLPAGVTLDHKGAEGFELHNPGTRTDEPGTRMSCDGASCTFSGVVVPEEMLMVRVPVDVELGGAELGGEQTVENVVHVSGGGAPDAFVRVPTVLSSTPAGFGIAPGSASVALSDSQAGAHADLTAKIGFDTVNGEGRVAGDEKETSVVFPPGFGGDLIDMPTCPVAHFSHEECTIETQVGVATIVFPGPLGREVDTQPVYDLTPEPGDVAKIGFRVKVALVQADVTVMPGTYALRTTFHNIDALDSQDLVSVTIWGVPASAAHDRWRWKPNGVNGLESEGGSFEASSSSALVPFLSSPTSCTGGPLPATFSSVSWQEPEAQPSVATPLLAPLSGCGALSLQSTFAAVPTTTNASAASGLNLEQGVHQTNEDPEGLAASALKKAVVTLPEGMTINPSAGAGLGACTWAQYEAEGLETPVGEGCPNDSKLGSVKIKTPGLKEEGTGSVYIAQPYANPLSEPGHPEGALIALYVVARFPVRGVTIKVAGKVEANPITGRLVTIFEGARTLNGAPSVEGLPPVPFSLFTFQFHQGETSPLVTPPACGDYNLQAELTPWSNPAQTLTDLSAPFEITSSFSGGACPAGGVPPFAPQFVAYPIHGNGGAFSPFYMRITRNDGEQEITGFSTQLPPGLTGILTGIPFCSEADIALARTKSGAEEEADPSCPVASEIGHTIAEAGVGEVLAQTPGKLYLAGPFEGAPFSVVSITSAKVGPFDLGTVVVHLPLKIDPQTAVVSIPSGPANQIPHILKGILIHLRNIKVYIDRPSFILNPTNCEAMSVSATVIGGGQDPTNPTDNDPVTTTYPFQAADCQSLKFEPKFQVSTSAKTSRTDGASLTAKLTYPTGSLGTEANIKEFKVDLPKQLPSRLTTLQKGCTAAQFNINPAGCPAASVVGYAKAITPLVPVPLEGPAYFVSHGGEAYPDLEMVLQGYGVTIIVTSNTFISKTGITSATLKTVPDQPFSNFELTLPEGPHSALTTAGNLCTGKLSMPTEMTGQNGDVIHQSTPVTVTGCPKTLHHQRKKHHHKRKKKRPRG